ncbi:MAG TPA: lipid II flippase MurJ, partial [Terriglobales bacterium]|nr:lipid II flippase MurJ [Terriglobales bacterium]
ILLYKRFGITSFAVGVVIGAAVGFFGLPLVTLPGIGARFRFSLAISHPGVRQFFKLSIPMMLALSVDITDTWIVRWFGSYLTPGSITWLTYARFISVVPIAIIAHAAGIASYPYLSQLYATGKLTEFGRAIATATKSLILVMLPIATLTIVLSKPLIQCVFTYTRLTQTDVDAVAAALSCFAVGMLARGTVHIMIRGFNAKHDTLTPAIIGTVLTFVTLPVYWIFARTWQYLGLAFASSIIVTLFVVILMVILFRESSLENLASVGTCLLKVSAASVVGGLICRLVVNSLQSWIPSRTVAGAITIFVVGAAIGFPLIILISRILGVKEVDHYCKKVYLAIPRFAVSSGS